MTLLLGIAFLGFELRDLLTMFDRGGTPSRSGFLSAFFALVPLHGLHVAAASLWLIAIVGQIAVYGVDQEVRVGLLRLGLLWHFLDIVWIGIFSVVYLAGLA
ncbi:cytochrome c oxidase subunit 3 [Pseudorhodobacter sp.]|uniref:cytochrome c oxidase subunit 3 n=1 Tax=Pseudorhodobacter sp. TaxID=1934400 RepID=UPI0026474169|nr:cytochrome c oxidase subunit 3 [Pseudorhodobacter sp.]MDN5787246.1 cytochrome c oxidase subunit 3 [Pseudorhodobacter sp.]